MAIMLPTGLESDICYPRICDLQSMYACIYYYSLLVLFTLIGSSICLNYSVKLFGHS